MILKVDFGTCHLPRKLGAKAILMCSFSKEVGKKLAEELVANGVNAWFLTEMVTYSVKLKLSAMVLEKEA